jgi:hypothetical protein
MERLLRRSMGLEGVRTTRVGLIDDETFVIDLGAYEQSIDSQILKHG